MIEKDLNDLFAALPEGWIAATIEEILAALDDGKLIHQGWSPQCETFPSKEDEWGVLKTTAIQDGYFLEYENKKLPVHLEPKSRIEVKEGDLLVTNAGPRSRCGVVTFVKKTRSKLMISGKMYRMRFNKNYVNTSLIGYWLRTSEIQWFINSIKTGINESGLNMTQERFFLTPIVLPPLAEQQQIAQKLDELLAQVDTLKTRLDAIPKILKRFCQSVLAAAVNGRLTKDWRATNVQKDWDSVFLKNMCVDGTTIAYGVIKLGDDDPAGIPCLRTSNVRWLNIELDGIKRISKHISDDYSRTILRGNEVLVNVRGTLGGVSIVNHEMIGWNVSREVAVVPVDSNKALNKFIAYLIGSNEAQRWLTGVQKGVAYTGINLEDLRELPINLPSLKEQAEIVRRVEQLFTYADQIERRVKDAQAQVNHLVQSILAKAFRGELTVDWREQNPELISGGNSATALLQRIKAEREATAKPKKRVMG